MHLFTCDTFLRQFLFIISDLQKAHVRFEQVGENEKCPIRAYFCPIRASQLGSNRPNFAIVKQGNLCRHSKTRNIREKVRKNVKWPLNVNSQKECGIFLNNTELTINNCIVNVKGYYGIAGKEGLNEKLLIRNATVTAEGEQGSICDLNSLTLEYSNISQPAGAAFDGSLHGVALGGELVKTQVVITRDPAGINTPTIDTAAKQGIYTLSGAKLGGKVEDLPKGMYIINSKKVVK